MKEKFLMLMVLLSGVLTASPHKKAELSDEFNVKEILRRKRAPSSMIVIKREVVKTYIDFMQKKIQLLKSKKTEQ